MATKNKRERGRPNKLNDNIEKARNYITEYKNIGDVVPSVAGLACYLNISRSTIYEWSSSNNDFSDIVEGILSLQENKLINCSLKGEFNPTISKLMLSKHGYVDKQETELSGKNGDAIEIDNKITIEFVGMHKNESAT